MNESHSTLTQERLKELLHYNPDTGEFTWNKNVSSTGRIGCNAGCVATHGYVVIRIDKRLYLAHRLAALYMDGKFPSDMIDHIDSIKSHNAWTNLRYANRSQNSQNKISAQSNNKKSGLLGVYWNEQNKKWGAKVNVDMKQRFAGYHATKELAHEAYLNLKRELHPFGMI